ncbi:MAG TPA: P-loop NTPase [Mariprofundaceae bacterium]|nr:P-loop NTPase [Mariprofundaceae bacterium]
MTVAYLNQQPAAQALAGGGPHIWAVASGKGGVGKSIIASSLGLALARLGKRVVLVDLDLGSANLHTCLGMTNPQSTLSDFIASRQQHINEFIQPVPDTKLGLISGASDGLDIANLKHFQKQKIIRNLKHIDADYVILDLGAGTSFNTLDFFLQAGRGILTVVPDPTSIENTYRFLKCVLTRRLHEAPEQTRKLIAQVLSARHDENQKIRTLAALMEAMRRSHPEHAQLLRRELGRQSLHLIVNQVTEPGDTELGPSMAMACAKYFGQQPDYLGHLNHDRHIVAAMRQRRPFLAAYPQSRVAVHLEHMAAALLDQDRRD